MNAYPVIGKTPSGSGWKVYAYGQPNNHLMDWRGMNVRTMALPKQPNFGFETKEKALAHLASSFATESDFKRWSFRVEGTFLTDVRLKSMEIVDIAWDAKASCWKFSK